MVDFDRIKKARIERYREIYKKYAKTNEQKELTIKFVKLELEGGDCPICKKEWNKIEVKNRFCKGVYYEPDCYCFPVCPDCGKKLYEEYASNIFEYNGWRCTNCRHMLIKDNQKRWGPEFEKEWPALKWALIKEAKKKMQEAASFDWKKKKKRY